ncbi:MAG TPA: hypothetical protein VGB98_16035 [Pyrinomonadaceae bacterium]|jgi:hypothetical protein
MAARLREVRAYIYTKNVKLKIPDADWIWVGLLTGPQWLFFIVVDTFFFPMRLFGILPEWVFTTPVCFIGSIVFFSYIHTGRLEKWFTHQILARLEAPTQRGLLPTDLKGKRRTWLVMKEGEGLPTYQEESPAASSDAHALNALRA